MQANPPPTIKCVEKAYLSSNKVIPLHLSFEHKLIKRYQWKYSTIYFLFLPPHEKDKMIRPHCLPKTRISMPITRYSRYSPVVFYTMSNALKSRSPEIPPPVSKTI